MQERLTIWIPLILRVLYNIRMAYELIEDFLLVSVLSFQIVSAYAKTYLVAVGVSDYPGTDKDLRLPANDAATIRYIYSKNSNVESVLYKTVQQQKCCPFKTSSYFSKAKTNDIIVSFQWSWLERCFLCIRCTNHI